MIVSPRGMGSAGSNTGVAVGGAIAAAGGVVSGTIIGLPAGAVMAAVGGLVALGSTIAGALHIGEGCGPTCIQATQLVNDAEPILRNNVTEYTAGHLDQGTALLNFNQVWTAVQQGCGAIPGAAGSNCVGDRQAGACKWKDANGQCWNWDIGYRQPLLVPNGVGVGVGSGVSMTNLTSDPMLMIGAGLLLLGLIVVGGK